MAQFFVPGGVDPCVSYLHLLCRMGQEWSIFDPQKISKIVCWLWLFSISKKLSRIFQYPSSRWRTTHEAFKCGHHRRPMDPLPLKYHPRKPVVWIYKLSWIYEVWNWEIELYYLGNEKLCWTERRRMGKKKWKLRIWEKLRELNSTTKKGDWIVQKLDVWSQVDAFNCI